VLFAFVFVSFFLFHFFISSIFVWFLLFFLIKVYSEELHSCYKFCINFSHKKETWLLDSAPKIAVLAWDGFKDDSTMKDDTVSLEICDTFETGVSAFCTDSIKPSLQFLCYFVVINASEGSLCFKNFDWVQSDI
jgi:hypothetical protein